MTQVCKLNKVESQKMMKTKWKKLWNYYIPKGKNGSHIVGMFYVNHFYVWMAREKWHLMHLKWCIIYCVILILSFPLLQPFPK